MFGTMDLATVLRHQAELRKDAARQRLAARINSTSKPKAQARRLFGLRLSIA